jgi:clan AA aspartic protease (TIGR02281 family)
MQALPLGIPEALMHQLHTACERTGVEIVLNLQGHVCKIVLADGQRIVANYDSNRARLWLAGGGFTAEYRETDGVWRSIESRSLLSDDLASLLKQLIAAHAGNARAGKVRIETTVAPSAQRVQAGPESPRHGPSPLWLAVLVPAALLAYYFSQKPKSAIPVQTSATPSAVIAPVPVIGAQPGLDASCENSLPEHGRTARFQGGAQSLDAPVAVAFDNAHDRDLLVYFTEPGSVKPIYSIFLKAKQKAGLQVASGRYELLFVHGRQWCNHKRGFLDGAMVKLNHEFDISGTKPLKLSLQSKGDGPLDFQVFSQDVDAETVAAPPPAMQIESTGALTLQIQPDGHYYVDSTVDSQPFRFVVDTGATITMLGKSAVGKVQVQNCVMGKVNTANGTIEACFGTVRELRIGPHVIYNAPVSINPNSDSNLLGMSVLGRFKLSSEAGLMRITQ